MKKITYILLSGIIYLFASCVEDNTQTVFKELNEVTIEGIEDEYENVYINRTFSIHPTLTTTFNDESQLDYLWIAYDRNSRLGADTLARTKDLDAIIGLTPGEHTGKFKVFDRTTGIYYEKEFIINVVNDFTQGLLILAENNGQAELNFWVPGRDELITDVFGLLNDGKSLGTNPNRVYFNKYTTDASSEVLVLCQDEEGGKILDNITMLESREYKSLFINDIGDVKPQAYFKNYMREYLIDNGLVYDRAVNTNPPSTTVKPYLSSPRGDYEIAENADFGDDESSVSRTVLYDNLNHCFYAQLSITSSSLTTVSSSGMAISGGFFDPDNVGMDCLYAGLSSRSADETREYIGVFETEGGERHLLRMGIAFYANIDEPSTYFKDLGNDVIQSPAINEAVSFSCSANFSGYLFYAAGNQIYVYNVLSRTGQALYDIGSGCTIDHIEIERAGNRLWVAFRDTQATSQPAGFVGLTIQTDGGLRLEESIRHEHFADRIVDFESKY